MNSSEISRNPLRRLILVVALLYGVALGLSVVPRVVRSVVPAGLRAIRHNVYQASLQNSTARSSPQCFALAKTRILVARLWNDFQ